MTKSKKPPWSLQKRCILRQLCALHLPRDRQWGLLQRETIQIVEIGKTRAHEKLFISYTYNHIFLTFGIIFNWEKIKANITKDKKIGNHKEFCFYFTIMVCNLHQIEFLPCLWIQSRNSLAKTLWEWDWDITFTMITNANDKQFEWCHVQCPWRPWRIGRRNSMEN